MRMATPINAMAPSSANATISVPGPSSFRDIADGSELGLWTIGERLGAVVPAVAGVGERPRLVGEALDEDGGVRGVGGQRDGSREREAGDRGGEPERRAHADTMDVMPVAAPPFAALRRDAAGLGLRLSDEQLSACQRYTDELMVASRTINLTAIIGPEAIAVKHLLDSFTAYAARPWTGQERIVDVGSGAGFPGVALKIALPAARLTCVEATGKKARFIEAACAAAGVPGVTVEHARAEDLARTPAHRARYDVATARALGTLGGCVELLFPFLRVGGDAIVWKGRVDAELVGAGKALSALGGRVSSIVPTASLGLGDQLPGRHLVVMTKTRPTPERYPRTPAEMKRRAW